MLTRKLFWSFTNSVSERAIFALVMLFVSFSLGPEEVGLAAISIALITVIRVAFKACSDYLVQVASLSDSTISTVLWTSVLLGLCMFSFLYMLAPSIAYYFKQPSLEYLIPLHAVSLIFVCSAVSSEGMIVRRHRFRLLAIKRFGSTVIGAFIGLYALHKDYGAASLIAFHGSVAILNASLALVFARPIVFGFDVEELARFIRFTKFLVGANLISELNQRAVDLFIAFALGTYEAGIYRIAQQFFLLFSSLVLGPIITLVLPLLSRMDRLKKSLTLGATLRLVFLLTLPSFLLGSNLLSTLSSLMPFHEWAPVFSLLVLISCSVVSSCINLLGLPALTSTGRPELAFRLSSLQFLSTLSVAFFFVDYGIWVLVSAQVLRGLVLAFYTLHNLVLVIGLSWRKTLIDIFIPLQFCFGLVFVSSSILNHFESSLLTVGLLGLVTSGLFVIKTNYFEQIRVSGRLLLDLKE